MKAFCTTLMFFATTAIAGPVGGDAPGQVAASAGVAVAPRPGHKWGTDPALRTGMSAIRAALAARLPAIRTGSLQPGDYQALGATIGARVRTILAECTLPPAADAQLHPILAALLVAAGALQGADASASSAATRDAVAAVNRYGQIFDDPGWQPLGTD